MRLQSAMEFMSTYAFMLIMVAFILIIIFYFAFPVQSTVPSQCNIIGGMQCSFAVYHPNHGFNTANMIFYLTNSGSAPINVIAANVIINNKTFVGTCSTPLLSPGAASLCYATVFPSSSSGSQVKGYINIDAGYCNSAVSQFGNALSQAGCTYTPISYTGAFSTYSTLITANSISTTSTTIAPSTLPLVATLTLPPEPVFQGTPLMATATTQNMHDFAQVQYYPCVGSCSAIPLGTKHIATATAPLSSLIAGGVYNFEACDASKNPYQCSGLEQLIIYGSLAVLLNPASTTAVYGNQDLTGPSETSHPSTPVLMDTMYIVYCPTSSCTTPTMTCTSLASCSGVGTATTVPNPFSLGSLGTVGTYYVSACDVNYQLQIGSACSPPTLITLNPSVPAPTPSIQAVSTGSPAMLSDGPILSSEGGGPYNYKWAYAVPGSMSFTVVSGATDPTSYTLTTTQNGAYQVELYAYNSGGSQVGNSIPATVTAVPGLYASLAAPNPAAADAGTGSGIPGENSVIKATIYGGSLHYTTCNWYVSSSSSGPFTTLAPGGSETCGSTSSTYTFNPTLQGMYYFEMDVIDTGSPANTFQTSPSSVVTVSSPLMLGSITTLLYTPPFAYTLYTEEVPNTMVVGPAIGGTGTYTYSWSKFPTGGGSDPCTSHPATTPPDLQCYFHPAQQITYTFYAAVTDSNDNLVVNSIPVYVELGPPSELKISCTPGPSPCNKVLAKENQIVITGTAKSPHYSNADLVQICVYEASDPSFNPDFGAMGSQGCDPTFYPATSVAEQGYSPVSITMASPYAYPKASFTFEACDYSYYLATGGTSSECSTDYTNYPPPPANTVVGQPT